MDRRTLRVSIFAAAVLALCLPALVAAQGRYGYPDYGRNGQYGRYDERYLKDSIHRLDRLAKQFERDLDRALDHSRVNGTRQEDRINEQGHDFRRAVGSLKSSFGNGRDLHRSRDEAQRVMEEARQFQRLGRGRRGIDNQTLSTWSQIQRELDIISDAYGLRYSNTGTYYPNDDWRRNDPNRTRNNNDWWRRIPWPTN